jgi:hypothetical protein
VTMQCCQSVSCCCRCLRSKCSCQLVDVSPCDAPCHDPRRHPRTSAQPTLVPRIGPDWETKLQHDVGVASQICPQVAHQDRAPARSRTEFHRCNVSETMIGELHTYLLTTELGKQLSKPDLVCHTLVLCADVQLTGISEIDSRNCQVLSQKNEHE